MKVLIVDDNSDFCENLRDILESCNHVVETACSGMQAVEAVKHSSPDLILMDVKLPDINGVETFKRIKSVASNVAVIMMSAYPVDDLTAGALKEGAFASLKKPFPFDLLFTLIERTKEHS